MGRQRYKRRALWMRAGPLTGLGVDSLRLDFVQLKYVYSSLAVGLFCIYFYYQGSWRTVAETAVGITKCQS